MTTEIEALKVFLKIPLVKVFILIMLLPSGVFGWLWYHSQSIILNNQSRTLEVQKDCNKEKSELQHQYTQKVEEIYKHFLEKTEKQIEIIREIQSQKSHEKVRKNNHRSGGS